TIAPLAATAGIDLDDGSCGQLPPKAVADELGRAWPRFASALAAAGPVLLVIENGHWADDQRLTLPGTRCSACGATEQRGVRDAGPDGSRRPSSRSGPHQSTRSSHLRQRRARPQRPAAWRRDRIRDERRPTPADVGHELPDARLQPRSSMTFRL